MLRERREKQQKLDIVILEQLVPKDHLLRRIDEAVDFSFIYDLCAPLYCADNGRPAIDPEVIFRMLIVGYLYGIKSEARLEEEINYNMAYNGSADWGLQKKRRTQRRSARTGVEDSVTTISQRKSSMRFCASALRKDW